MQWKDRERSKNIIDLRISKASQTRTLMNNPSNLHAPKPTPNIVHSQPTSKPTSFSKKSGDVTKIAEFKDWLEEAVVLPKNSCVPYAISKITDTKMHKLMPAFKKETSKSGGKGILAGNYSGSDKDMFKGTEKLLNVAGHSVHKDRNDISHRNGQSRQLQHVIHHIATKESPSKKWLISVHDEANGGIHVLGMHKNMIHETGNTPNEYKVHKVREIKPINKPLKEAVFPAIKFRKGLRTVGNGTEGPSKIVGGSHEEIIKKIKKKSPKTYHKDAMHLGYWDTDKLEFSPKTNKIGIPSIIKKLKEIFAPRYNQNNFLDRKRRRNFRYNDRKRFIRKSNNLGIQGI